MNKFLKITLGSLLFLTLVISVFYYFLNKNKYQKNGFTRKFLTAHAQLINTIPINSKSYYFARTNPDYPVIYDLFDPSKILRLSPNLTPTAIPSIPPKLAGQSTNDVNFIFIQNKEIYYLNKKNATVYTSDIQDHHYLKSKLDTIPFNLIQAINRNSYILNTKDTYANSPTRILKKVYWKGEASKSFQPEGQVESYFSTDGFYKYDFHSKKIIYGYFYRGEFLCLDTNLNLIYKAKTIDTIRNARIMIRKTNVLFKGQNIPRYTHLKPPKIVNRNLSISNGYIHIQSYLKADNEKLSTYKKKYVFDIYALSDGSYIASYYIRRIKGKSLSDFKVFENRLYAIHENQLAVYTLPAN